MDKRELNKVIKNNNLDVIVSLSQQTKFWYTGVDASAGWLFINKNKSHLMVDGRYIEDAKKLAKNVEVHLLDGIDTLKEFAKKNKYKNIGIEANYLTIHQFRNLQSIFPKAKFVEIDGAQLRIIKTDEEVKIMTKAMKLQLKALDKVSKKIKAGMTEKEVANMLENEYKLAGADELSFETIVASGKNGSRPHGKATTKKISSGEMVTIDSGIRYKGYATDITRTYVVGKLTNKKLIEIKEVLTEAQKLGVKAVKPGVTTNSIDKICRDYITQKGYGEFFSHGTGHGLGIDVHEYPNVSPRKASSVKLRAGMIITIEPGIYIPGLGGIRIEDDVLVTKTGNKVLSK